MIMGWAKYAEDNNEIILERQREVEEKQFEGRSSFHNASTIFQTQIVPNIKTREKNTAYLFQKKIDIYLCCKECGRMFTFTVSSQHFCELKGWSAPKRCKACREHKKALTLNYSLQ